MSLNVVKNSYGGTGLTDAGDALKEIQGLNCTVVAGATANTKVNVAAMRTEDTLLEVVFLSGAAAASGQKANCTIQDTHASGTLTVAAVADADVCVVDGTTFTFKDTPILNTHIKRTAGDNNANAAALAAGIKAYFTRLKAGEVHGVSNVTAVASSAVVTITAVADGTAGNSIVLTGTPTRLAASGSGTLAGGTATGGIKCTTDTSAGTLVVFWYNKR